MFTDNKAIAQYGYGGAIYVGQKSKITLINTEFKNNYATTEGGALYVNKQDLEIQSGVIFKNNAANNQSNDIFLNDGYLTLNPFQKTNGSNFDSEENKIQILSGIKSNNESTNPAVSVKKNAYLVLSGVNNQFYGNFYIETYGTVQYIQSGSNNFVTGPVYLYGNLKFENNDPDQICNLTGEGTLNKNGNGTLTFTGNNINFNGELNIQAGSVKYTFNDDQNSSFINGTIKLSGNSSLTVDIQKDYTNTFKQLAGSENTKFYKEGDGTLALIGNDEIFSGFNGSFYIEKGTLQRNVTNQSFINSNIIRIQPNATLEITNDEPNDVLFKKLNGDGFLIKNGSAALIATNNPNFTNGNLVIKAGEFKANNSSVQLNTGTFSDKTVINLQKDLESIQNTRKARHSNTVVLQKLKNSDSFNFQKLTFNDLTLNGQIFFNVDIDLANQQADTIEVLEQINTTEHGHLLINQQSLNLLSDTNQIHTPIRIANNLLRNRKHLILSDEAKIVNGETHQYRVSYGTDGELIFTKQPDKSSPETMSASISTQVGGLLVQLEALQAGFFHMERYTKYNLHSKLSNGKTVHNGGANSMSSPSFWIKPYTSFQSIRLNDHYRVANTAYGSFIGGDTALYDLGNEYQGLLSAFIGYNGSHQNYSGIQMDQLGGSLGITGTLYKRNFFSGLTLSTTTSAGHSYTEYGKDVCTTLTAGAASKTGYNFELNQGKLIVQPSLFISYIFINNFNYTHVAQVNIKSSPLHTMQLIPEINFIANLKNNWQPYMTVSMVWNFLDKKTNFILNQEQLTALSLKPYVQYGAGVQKTYNDKWVTFLQSTVKNGGINGVDLVVGLRLKI